MLLTPSQLARAIRSNRTYAHTVGWVRRFDQIVQVLGFAHMTPGEEQFAQAVADWQKRSPPLVPDGMLGRQSWSKLEPQTRFTVGVAAPPPRWLSSAGAKGSAVAASSSVAPRYILAAIDGTGSRQWRRPDGSNSHTHRFYQHFLEKGGRKMYLDGPDDFGIAVQPLINGVVYFIQRSLQESPDAEVCLIGHSRGGFIAMVAASRLASVKRVHFLGMYDAVDRTHGVDQLWVTNVNVAYHAIRDPSVRSRSYFGNAGLHGGADVKLVKQYFKTTHGGIGGDPEGGHYNVERYMTVPRPLIEVPNPGTGIRQEPLLTVTLEQSRLASLRAGLFIRQGALLSGLKLG